MKAFEEVRASLQIGVRKAAAPPSGYLPPLNLSPEKAVLAEAAALDLLQRAGARGRTDVMRQPPCPADERLVAVRSADPLAHALDENMTDNVLVWADSAAEKGLLLPPSLLVRFMPIVAKHPGRLVPVLGERGMWLASLMEFTVSIPSDQVDPTVVREQIKTEWVKMDWKERERCIIALAHGLSTADEPFLKEAMLDKRQEVRVAAARNLLRLPNSELTRSLVAVARGRIVVVRKLLSKSLSISPPDPGELPTGIPKTTSHSGFGPKALALYDMVRHLSPSLWEAETGLHLEDLVSLAEGSEYADGFILGVVESVVRNFADKKWIDPLYKRSLTKGPLDQFELLARAVSRESYEGFTAPLLQQNDRALSSLGFRTVPFTAKFSRAAVEAVQGSQTRIRVDFVNCLDLSVLPLIGEPWTTPSEPVRQEWRRILEVRKRLLDSLI